MSTDNRPGARAPRRLGSPLTEFGHGRPVVLVWDLAEPTPKRAAGPRTSPRPAAELLVAAQHASAESIAFTVRHGSGFVRVALREDAADRLDLPTMYLPGLVNNPLRDTVSVDAANGATTGISAADRALTMRLLANPDSTPHQFTRPGHVVPMRVRDVPSAGMTPAGIALAMTEALGLHSAVAMCTLVSARDPLSMADTEDGAAFAALHGIGLVRASDIAGPGHTILSHTLAAERSA